MLAIGNFNESLKNLDEIDSVKIKIDSLIDQKPENLRTKEDFEKAAQNLSTIRGLIKSIKLKFDGPKSQAYKLHKDIRKLEKELLDPLEKIEEVYSNEIAMSYQDIQLDIEHSLSIGKEHSANKMIESIEGIRVKESYTVEITDFVQLVKAVSEGVVPMNYLQVNFSAINKDARDLGGYLEVPGCSIVKSVKTVSNSRFKND